MNLQNSNFFGTEKQLNLDTFLRMSDVASQFRKLEEEVGKQLDVKEAREILRGKLLELARIKGEDLTAEQVDAAIDNYYSDQYSFKEPPKNFGTTLVNWYVDRTKIVIGTVALAAAIAVPWLTIERISTAHKRSLERAVETTVQKAYYEKQELEKRLVEISSFLLREQLPASEGNKLKADVESAGMRLNSTENFFREYCDDGTAEDDVTQKNYEEIKTKFVVINDSLKSARTQLEDGVRIIDTQKQFISTKQSLDSLLGEIRNTKPTKVFQDRAETLYANGITCINNRQLSEAQKYQQQLTGIKQDIGSFSGLTEKLEKLYSNIKTVAKEDVAKVQGEEIYQEAKQFERAADIPRLRQSIGQLENLDVVLNQEYTLKIGQDSEVKSGIDRYYNGKFSGWYIFVEAINKQTGRAILRDITNCETGRTEKVALWGQKVDEKDPDVIEKIKRGIYNSDSVLQRIVKDKLDDGIVNNNVIGKKEKGYLNEKINVDGFLGEKITSW